jgi:uncharacterized protein YqgC (DUF456 family)
MPQWLDISLHVFVFLVMLGGVLVSIIPMVPGVVIVWLAGLLFGIASGFGTLGWAMFALLTLLMIAGTLVDNVLMGAKARGAGASWYAIAFALLAGIVGSFAFPPLGGIIAAPAAVFVFELIRLKDSNQAWIVTKGLMTGWGLSSLARVSIALVMMIVWGIWAYFG